MYQYFLQKLEINWLINVPVFSAFMQLLWIDKHIIFYLLSKIKVIFMFQASPSS